MQTVQPIFFIPAMLVGNIDFCLFISLSLTFTAFGDHKVIAKQNLLVSFSHTFFHVIRMKFDVVIGQFKENILRLHLSMISLKLLF